MAAWFSVPVPRRLIGRRWLLAGVALIAALGGTALADEAADKDKAAKDKAAREAIQLTVECAFVIDRESTESVANFSTASKVEEALAALRKPLQTAVPTCADGVGFQRATGALTGAGDVVVVVAKDKYALALQAAEKQALSPRLFLNGFDQGKDASLVSTESKGQSTSLRFHVRRGDDNKALWAALYEEQRLLGAVPLRIGLGWSTGGATGVQPAPLDGFNKVRISDEPAVALASLFIFVLLAGTAWVMLRTDAFRDASRPAFWQRADLLRQRLVEAMAANVRLQGVGKEPDDAIRKRILAGLNGGAGYETGFHPSERYDNAATRALGDPTNESLQTDDALIGLALARKPWQAVRSSYSLGRLQVGFWFVFAVGAGVFLWIVFGQLPVIPPSLLALLTVSTATAATSLASDKSAGGRPFTASRGLMADLVTGFDDKQQVHRFQALVVNAMLLCVGIYGVSNELALPVFDASWLGFLGLSGIAFAAGKQLAETPAAGGTVTGKSAPATDTTLAGGSTAGSTPASVPAGRSV